MSLCLITGRVGEVRPTPDGSDLDAVAECAASGAEILGNDRVVAGVAAAQIGDRASSAVPPVQMANQLGMCSLGSIAIRDGGSALASRRYLRW